MENFSFNCQELAITYHDRKCVRNCENVSSRVPEKSENKGQRIVHLTQIPMISHLRRSGRQGQTDYINIQLS
jgi:hypothetical protein